MAQVRMHSPPARTIKRLSGRWDRQRPSTRGGVHDHGGSELDTGPLTITSVTPSTVVAGATTTSFSVVGEAFLPGSVIKYKVGAEAEKTATTSAYTDSSHYAFSIPTADLDSAATITWTMATPSADPVAGPNITVTAA